MEHMERGVSRIDQKSKNNYGYYVRIQSCGTIYKSKFFNDRKYGGRHEARSAANLYSYNEYKRLREKNPLIPYRKGEQIHIGLNTINNPRMGVRKGKKGYIARIGYFGDDISQSFPTKDQAITWRRSMQEEVINLILSREAV